MTTYGTISTSPSPLGANLEYISRANQRSRSGIANQRSWKEMLNYRSFIHPSTLEEATGRLRINLDYFLTNYVIVVLMVLFLGLLWHPLSLIVLTLMMVSWLFLYFLRDKQLVIFDYMIDDRVVLFVLLVNTIISLLLTGVKFNVLVSSLFGTILVLVHAAFRKIDNLFIDEEAVNGATPFLLQK